MEQLPVYCRKKILIVGCGNKLFGDDGFGPEVVISLSEARPEIILVIDAVDKERKPGEIFDISLNEIPKEKIDDFSIHQVPSSNLLKELQDLCSVKVRIMACQIKTIPETIQSGLSKPVKKAVRLMAKKIAEEYF